MTGGRVCIMYDFDTYYNGRASILITENILWVVAKTPQELIAAIQSPAEDESEIGSSKEIHVRM